MLQTPWAACRQPRQQTLTQGGTADSLWTRPWDTGCWAGGTCWGVAPSCRRAGGVSPPSPFPAQQHSAPSPWGVLASASDVRAPHNRPPGHSPEWAVWGGARAECRPTVCAVYTRPFPHGSLLKLTGYISPAPNPDGGLGYGHSHGIPQGLFPGPWSSGQRKQYFPACHQAPCVSYLRFFWPACGLTPGHEGTSEGFVSFTWVLLLWSCPDPCPRGQVPLKCLLRGSGDF